MKSQKPQDNSPAKRPTVEELISTEWATLKQLEAMLCDPELTVKERTSVANVLAFHVNTLNRLLLQTGQKEEFDEQNLGDFVRGVEPRIANQFRRDIRAWKRTLSLRRS
jgi:hypothetical protein